MGETSKLFVREATGLVRQFGFLDQFVMSQATANWLPGIPLVALYAPFFFPGAYLPLVVAIGAIPAFGMAVVYSRLSAMIPRSGGDYVWSSRILGPLYGSIQFIFIFALFIITAIGTANIFFPTIGLSQVFFAVGVVQHNTDLIHISTALGSSSLGYPASIALVIVATLVPLFGLRFYAWIQGLSYLFIYVAVAALGIGLVVLNFSSVPSAFDQAMQVAGYNATYSSIISSAPASAFQFSLTNTVLAALPWGFLSFIGFNFGAYLSGETKSARSTFPKALYSSVAVTATLLAGFIALVLNDFGAQFINGASYVVANNAASLPTLPTVTVLLALVNLPLGIFAGLAITLGLVVVCIANTVQLSRIVFAASFDRLVPDLFSRVSLRFRVPYVAVLLVGVITAIYMTIYWKAGFAVTYLNNSLVLPIGLILPLLAILLFPIVKPDYYRRIRTGTGSYVPVIIGALVGIVGLVIYIIAETVPIISGVFVGASLVFAYGTVAGVVVLGVLVYATATLRTKRLGADFKRIFSEIPPE